MQGQGGLDLVGYRHLILDLPAGLVDFDSSLMSSLRALSQAAGSVHDDAYLLRRFDSLFAYRCNIQPESSLEACLGQVYTELRHELDLPRDLAATEAFIRRAVQWVAHEDVPGALLYLRKFFTLSVLCPQPYQAQASAIPGVRFLEGELCDEVRVDQRVPALFIGGRKSQLPEGADWCWLQREAQKSEIVGEAALVVSSLLELVVMHQTQLRGASTRTEGCMP
ncbi:hypothetical protein [Marinobacterium lutimaris]|uniref:Uncharacterized protein n=1 Tax=Marinobacterium lutimaris TaxID=568106 RepID=A0A1H6DP59_9GAMM|nr:hypothetical protein [Marinobacterium lutimaris]SEG86981.1 hypothetical protein SAMN05444390_10820 [Marinobacterium lutimaris]